MTLEEVRKMLASGLENAAKRKLNVAPNRRADAILAAIKKHAHGWDAGPAHDALRGATPEEGHARYAPIFEAMAEKIIAKHGAP